MRAIRRFSVGLSVIAILASPAAAQQTATIGAWNVTGNFNQLTQTRINAVADAISRFTPDLLLLTEVHHHSALQQIADRLRTHHNLPYSAAIIDQDQTILDIGILFRDHIDVAATGLIDGSDLDHNSLRQAYWADITIQDFDFRIIGLHLKSSGGQANIDTRNQQAAIIADFITDFVQGAAKDVLLVGDYNMFPKRDSIVFATLSASGFVRFISSEAFCTGPTLDPCLGTHIQGDGAQAHDGNLLDGFAISTNHTGELTVPVSRVNLPQLLGLSLGDYKSTVADHYPIVATFRVDQDDDGQASANTLRIDRVIPNPLGNDLQNEEITLENRGLQALNLSGWRLRDLAGQTWILDPLLTVQFGQSVTIVRNGQAMALNNNGDTVDLIDPANVVIHRVTYGAVTEGQVITPP